MVKGQSATQHRHPRSRHVAGRDSKQHAVRLPCRRWRHSKCKRQEMSFDGAHY
jgi:hypothetical protein